MVKNEQGCWYEVWIEECVLCGAQSIIKERRAPPKPDLEQVYHFSQRACWDHFL